MIDIVELQSITPSQANDILALMKELNPNIPVSPGMLEEVVRTPGSHLFVAVEADDADGARADSATAPTDGPRAPGRIVGCANLCVYSSPTGRKASVEDVVVASACRGQHLGKRLIEHIIGFARRELAPVDLGLTSRPSRVAANNLYRSMGFKPKETNVYKMPLTASGESE